MIKNIKVRNFKSLLNIEIGLNSLNLLTGINGLGKSSLIQILLILRQSYFKSLLPSKGLLINGELISLGKSSSVLSIGSSTTEIEFYFETDNFGNGNIVTSAEDQDTDFLPIISEKSSFDTTFFDCTLFNNSFQYLNAERISPKSAYPSSLFEVAQNGSIGIHGEYTSLFIALNKREKLALSYTLHPKATTPTLLDQISAWLSEISPGFSLDTNYFPEIDYSNFIYQLRNIDELSYNFSASNVGFGLTYVLPVITAILSSKPGDLVIIENPESHIHPRGQSKLGELFFLAARDGVQLIIETHSDHILNGIRAAVNKCKNDSQLVKLLYFQRPSNGDTSYIDLTSPLLDNNGRINEWPDGFFDEWEKTLIELV